MSRNTSVPPPWAPITAQPGDVRELPEPERDLLIISAAQVDGKSIILSRYADDIWQIEGFSNNVSASHKRMDFGRVPLAFRAVMKAMLYRYLMRGRRESGRPKGPSVRVLFNDALLFVRHLESLEITRLEAATPTICATYVDACKAYRQTKRSIGKPLSQRALQSRFNAVEAVHELSQYTEDQMAQHPWPDTSGTGMAGLKRQAIKGGNTALMPDDVFCTLFERAYQMVERGKQLLSLRDELDAVTAKHKGKPPSSISTAKKRYLEANGWGDGLRAFNLLLIELRTACYIVLASTSGCRNHELANVQSGAHHRTQDDEGTIYHWMRSLSEKTDIGIHDWMIPEVAVRALRVMEHWSAPHQAIIGAEIVQRRRIDPHDPQIAEARKHQHSLFLGVYANEGNQVRTLSGTTWDSSLKVFAKNCGLSWKLSSHQFRRKFANYVAHSRFGDLRYLKEHYAHWSMDMTLGYAMDESWGQHLDLDLYIDIEGELEDIKLGVVDDWLEHQPLAGGYGGAIERWRREPQNLLIFKDRASMVKSIAESTPIRSNGHAWCTAENDGCVGNTLDRTRCGNCENSVINARHAPIYQRLYTDLKELMHCQDIGEGGRQRVERDLKRCRDVLIQLGIDLETLIA